MKLEVGRPPKVVVAGMSGTGKTTLCRLLVEQFRPRCVVWDPMGQYPSEISYRPRRFDDAAEADALVRRVMDAGPFVIEWEEIEQIYAEKGGGWLPPFTKQYVLMWRNYGSGWIANVRQPQRVSKTILNEADDLILFKLSGTALDYVVSLLGRDDGPRLYAMRKWHKDEHRFFHRRPDGELVERHWLPKDRAV